MRLTQHTAVHHVRDASRRADNDVDASVAQLLHVLAHVRTPDAGETLRRHVVAECQHHFLSLRHDQQQAEQSRRHSR